MSNYTNLKNAIQSVIKANGNNEITGPILQAELLSMITTLGAGYQYMGVAQPSTNPGTPDARVMYLAYLPGTYVNFGGLVVTGFCVLKYDTVWSKEDIPISGGGGADFLTEPDDLTLETVGNTKILKFANRAYNIDTPNGLGYKILRGNLTFAEQVTEANTVYEIRYDFDLGGNDFVLPANTILRFNGGRVYGGKITGGKMPTAFQYTPEMFGAGMTNDDTQAIQNAVNLCYKVLLSGNYNVKSVSGYETSTALTYANPCIMVPSNSDIEVNGTINLTTSNLDTYAIFSITGVENVRIHGLGKIIGDVETTSITTGEWGMGIAIYSNSQNIRVDGLEISQCYGDGIMIKDRGESQPKFVNISNIYIHHCRRQGISIVAGDQIIIDGFIITNISGKAPQSAIDVENQTATDYGVGDIVIRNGSIKDCVNGIYCNATQYLARSILVENVTTDAPIYARINSIIRNCVGMNALLYVAGTPIVENCRFGALQAASSAIGPVKIYNSYFQGVQNETGSTNTVELYDCEIEIFNYDNGEDYETKRILYCCSTAYCFTFYRCKIYIHPVNEEMHYFNFSHITAYDCFLHITTINARYAGERFYRCKIELTRTVSNGFIYNYTNVLEDCIINILHGGQTANLYQMATDAPDKLTLKNCVIYSGISNPQGNIRGTITDLNYINDNGTVYRKVDGSLTYPEHGTTTVRTNMATNIKMKGKLFFDETLPKLLVFDGTNWINIDGTPLA